MSASERAGTGVRVGVALGSRLRRALFWTHRWLGIAGCLLFVMWFASGLVMMYVGYPSLTSEERLQGLSPLATQAVRVTAQEVIARGPEALRTQPPRRVVLEMMADGPAADAPLHARPVWRIVDAKGLPHAYWADDGRRVGPVSAEQAQGIARLFSGAANARVVESLERDQWTVPQGLNPLRPLYRVELQDAAATELYVSAVTGEVVRDTTRRERIWNWLGSVPHWLYFTPLRADPPLWRTVVIWISGACIVAAVSGMVLGILRVRLRTRYRGNRRSPYQGWMRWHHIAGLLGGVFLTTWVVSGWLSMDPNGWFQRAASNEAALRRWQGTPHWDLPLPLSPPLTDARSLSLRSFNGRLQLEWRDAAGQQRVTDAETGQPVQLSRDELLAAAHRYQPEAAAVELEQLQAEDAYWYGHHAQRQLPVWRLKFQDDAGTWLHVDPASAQVLGVSNAQSRLRRWLFNAPHSLDFPWLIQNRPGWDAVMALLSALGLVMSISGVVVGVRRLAHAGSRRRPRSS